jgi:pimeloyl-ACP methyl ester carboxylesterase
MKLKQKLAIGYIRLKFRLFTIISKRMAAEKAFELFCTPFMQSESKTPAIFGQAEALQFELNGLKVNGFRWNFGQPHTILILHGFSSSAYKFHAYIAPLMEKGYQVIAFDAPAHGSSEGVTINAVQYSEMIEKVVQLYGPIKGYLAHSFAGIALSLAIEKTMHHLDTHIVLIAPATETATAVDAAFTMLNIQNTAVRREFDNIIFERSGHTTEWFSIKRAMQQISASVLWIHDEEDDITPLADALQVKKEHFPNIRFIITKGLGHKKIYRDITVKKEIIDFL